jgi:formamidopyrimidine-DNA glycosylase
MKRILENLTCLAIGFTFAVLMIWILDVNWERRFTLYHIRNELKKDISKAKVEEIINRHQAQYITRFETDEGINLLVHLGMADSLSLIDLLQK